MTIKQFLEKQTLNSGAKLRFRFTDQQGINWSYEAPASHLTEKVRLFAYFHRNAKMVAQGQNILNFPCDLKCNEGNSYTFDLDLNKIPEDLFTTFSEIYEHPIKNEGKNITVQEYLQEMQKRRNKKNQPKIFFRQRIFMSNSDDRENTYSFITQNAASLDEAVNGPFSNLSVYGVSLRPKDDALVIELATTATEKEQEQEAKETDLYVSLYIGAEIGTIVGAIIGIILGKNIEGVIFTGMAIGTILSFIKKKTTKEDQVDREKTRKKSQLLSDLNFITFGAIVGGIAGMLLGWHFSGGGSIGAVAVLGAALGAILGGVFTYYIHLKLRL